MLHMIEAACHSHTGKVRENNEDNFYFDETFVAPESEGLLAPLYFRRFLKSGTGLAVFDGMGGGDYGEIASFLAAEYMQEALGFADRSASIPDFLRNMCLGMNQRVVDRQTELHNYRIGSTVAGLYFYRKSVWAFNVGDSRIYHLRGKEPVQLSVNHTDEAYLKEHEITGRKPRLLQHLGIATSEMQLEPHVAECEYKRGDMFLLCSDGLTDMVSEHEITEILQSKRTVKEKADTLVKEALKYGGKDNITVIVCQM